MELKDVILSTLAEMEDEAPGQTQKSETQPTVSDMKEEKEILVETAVDEQEQTLESEMLYLNSIRERLLVLFEGFQAPNNANIEAKVDMTLNFLEYTLATIDARLEKLQKGSQL